MVRALVCHIRGYKFKSYRPCPYKNNKKNKQNVKTIINQVKSIKKIMNILYILIPILINIMLLCSYWGQVNLFLFSGLPFGLTYALILAPYLWWSFGRIAAALPILNSLNFLIFIFWVNSAIPANYEFATIDLVSKCSISFICVCVNKLHTYFDLFIYSYINI